MKRIWEKNGILSNLHGFIEKTKNLVKYQVFCDQKFSHRKLSSQGRMNVSEGCM